MIGIDTNILLRFFGGEDDKQTTAARTLVRDEAPVFVNPIVLAEFVWTLRATYKLDRQAVYERLAGIIQAPEFAVAYPDATERAVAQYGAGPADFADYLSGELNLMLGCSETVTFDRAAAKSAVFRHLNR